MNTVIEILVDNSNSMGNCKGIFENYKDYLLPDGSTRMELAKKILLSEILPTIDYASKITLSLFHSVNTNDNEQEVVQPILHEGHDNEALKKSIVEIKIPYKTGGTPITDALINCIDRLKSFSADDKKIILVTDGQETGEKDYKVAAKKALEVAGISCNIFIVGIGLDSKAKLKAEELVKETNGQYLHLESSNYNKATIQSKLSPLKSELIADTIKKISTSPAEKIERDNIEEETNKSDKIREIEKQLSDNNKILNLLSKQVSLLQEELSKKTDFEDSNDENLFIHEDSEFNEKIRKTSEKHLYDLLKEKFGNRLEWLNSKGESGESFDFKVVDNIDGSIEYFIECKGTIGKEKVFYLTKNEWSLFLKNTNKYQIYFISEALLNPKVTKIDNLHDWIMKEKVVPYPIRNRKQKAERIIFTVLD